MTLRPGDVLRSRFEVCSDEDAWQNARDDIAMALWDDCQGVGLDLLSNPNIWLRGVDRETAESVLIEPRGSSLSLEDAWATEAVARQVAATAPPFAVEVLHIGQGIVYSEPPTGLPRGTSSREEAAELALQACEVTARLHAVGVARLCFDPQNLRVSREGTCARIHWLIPGSSDLALLWSRGPSPKLLFKPKPLDKAVHPILCDIWNLIDFFFRLQPEDARFCGADPEIDTLSRMLEDPLAPPPPDVAALARLFLPLAPASANRASRVAELPSVGLLPRLCFAWDQIIAEGEALMAKAQGKRARARHFIALPLAAAYHQRASRNWASGDLAAALEDAEGADNLDGAFWPYKTTRAVLLDALGRVDEARRNINAAIALTSATALRGRAQPLANSELARAYAARGMIALRRGMPAEAERDLCEAMGLHATALYAHCLGAALHALGDFKRAAEAEARSVELSPTNTRYRWALVQSLRKLGRDREALAQAEQIVAMDPSNTSHRKNLAVLSRRKEQGREEEQR